VLKVYDKTFQQRQAGNLKVESNIVRVELVFLDRMLDRMYSNKKSLEDILTRKAIKTLIDQYQVTFDEICKNSIIYTNRHGDGFIFFGCYNEFIHNAIKSSVLF